MSILEHTGPFFDDDPAWDVFLVPKPMNVFARWRADPNATHWLCKDGRLIAIREMETSHLENAMAMLVRMATKAAPGVDVEKVIPCYRALRKEHMRRVGLK